MNKSDKSSLLKIEFHRHATFKQWPFDDTKKCNPKRLAEAGFYKSGSHRDVDLVKCFLCSKELDGWDENDDPWEEHKSHASYCMFAKIGKPESLMTAAEYLGVVHQFQINRIQKEYDGFADLLEEAIKKMHMKISFSKCKN